MYFAKKRRLVLDDSNQSIELLEFRVLPLDIVSHIFQFDSKFPLSIYSNRATILCRPYLSRYIFRREENNTLTRAAVDPTHILFLQHSLSAEQKDYFIDSQHFLESFILNEKSVTTRFQYPGAEFRLASTPTLVLHNYFNWNTLLQSRLRNIVLDTTVALPKFITQMNLFTSVLEQRTRNYPTGFTFKYNNPTCYSMIHEICKQRWSPNFIFFPTLVLETMGQQELEQGLTQLKELSDCADCNVYTKLFLNVPEAQDIRPEATLISVDYLQIIFTEVSETCSFALPKCKALCSPGPVLLQCVFPHGPPDIVVSFVTDFSYLVSVIYCCLQQKIPNLMLVSEAIDGRLYEETNTILQETNMKLEHSSFTLHVVSGMKSSTKCFKYLLPKLKIVYSSHLERHFPNHIFPFAGL